MAARKHPTKAPKGGFGRNTAPVVVDWEKLHGYAIAYSTHEELAAVSQCSIQGLDAACLRDNGMSLEQWVDEKRGEGRSSLRGKQYQIAMQGSVPMLIWLGKQILGQTEKSKVVAELLGDFSQLSDKELLERIEEMERRKFPQMRKSPHVGAYKKGAKKDE